MKRPYRFKLLIVDDDKETLEILSSALKNRHFFIETCSDSTKVMDLIKANEYDLIILDIRMPKVEGTDLCWLIRRDFPRVNIIMLTALHEKETETECYKLGADKFIAKPFSMENLKCAIKTLLFERIRPLKEVKKHAEREAIKKAIRFYKGNLTRTAQALGITRSYLHRKIKEYNILH
jgi:DNA-binding NtrC family response regulator